MERPNVFNTQIVSNLLLAIKDLRVLLYPVHNLVTLSAEVNALRSVILLFVIAVLRSSPVLYPNKTVLAESVNP